MGPALLEYDLIKLWAHGSCTSDIRYNVPFLHPVEYPKPFTSTSGQSPMRPTLRLHPPKLGIRWIAERAGDISEAGAGPTATPRSPGTGTRTPFTVDSGPRVSRSASIPQLPPSFLHYLPKPWQVRSKASTKWTAGVFRLAFGVEISNEEHAQTAVGEVLSQLAKSATFG